MTSSMQTNVTARTPSPVVVVVTPAGTPAGEPGSAHPRPGSGRDRSPDGLQAPATPPGMRRTSLRPISGENDTLSSPLLTVPGLSDSTEHLKQDETETTHRNDNSNLTLFAPSMSAPTLYKSSTLPIGSPTFQKVLLEIQAESTKGEGNSDNEAVAGMDSKKFSKENSSSKYPGYRRRSSVTPAVQLRRKSVYAK